MSCFTIAFCFSVQLNIHVVIKICLKWMITTFNFANTNSIFNDFMICEKGIFTSGCILKLFEQHTKRFESADLGIDT